MMLAIPDLLDKRGVARVRAIVDAGDWQDGNATSGHQSALAKHNEQLAEDSAGGAGGRAGWCSTRSAGRPCSSPRRCRSRSSRLCSTATKAARRSAPISTMRCASIAAASSGCAATLSATLFLDDPDSYEGGELVVEGNSRRRRGQAARRPSPPLSRLEPASRRAGDAAARGSRASSGSSRWSATTAPARSCSTSTSRSRRSRPIAARATARWSGSPASITICSAAGRTEPDLQSVAIASSGRRDFLAKSTTLRLRGLWLQLHKWIGICLAILIIPISISGAALVWHDWLDETLNPQRYAVTASDAALPPSAYAAAARGALAPGERIAVAPLSRHGDGPIIVDGDAAPGAGRRRRPAGADQRLARSGRAAACSTRRPSNAGMVRVPPRPARQPDRARLGPADRRLGRRLHVHLLPHRPLAVVAARPAACGAASAGSGRIRPTPIIHHLSRLLDPAAACDAELYRLLDLLPGRVRRVRGDASPRQGGGAPDRARAMRAGRSIARR